MFKAFSSSALTRFLHPLNKFNAAHHAYNKVVNSLDEALEGLKDGHKILVGGFGLCGIPENLIRHISKSSLRNLTLYTCTCGMEIKKSYSLIHVFPFPLSHSFSWQWNAYHQRPSE